MAVGAFSLWQAGEELHKLALVGNLRPRLASWDAGATTAQQRVSDYLSRLETALRPHLAGEENLFLHMDIAVPEPASLTHHHDLENYLTPVVHHLGWRHFVLVSATKLAGVESALRTGRAAPLPGPAALADFAHHAVAAGQGAQIKARIHAALAERVAAEPGLRLPAPPAQAEVHLAWRCDPARRAWHNLWKLTGDAMGPILGVPHAHQPFNPHDDRITALHLHRTDDPALGNDVEVGLWWRERVS